jgi:hypothetical protein
MKIDESIIRSRDILSNRQMTIALYWIPVLVLIVSGFLNLDQLWRVAIWTAALTTMAAGCIANALRCGRMHCYVTGPFLLIMAIVVLTRGLGATPIDDRSWNLIGLVVLVGTLVLWFVPEMFLGRYRQRRGIGVS